MLSTRKKSGSVHRSFISGLFSASMGQIFRRLVSVFGNLYLLRILKPTEMGEFVILQFFVTQVPFYVGTGLNMALVREADKISSRVKRSAVTFQIAVSSLLALGIWAITGHIQAFYNDDGFVSAYLPWLLLLTPVLIVQQILVMCWQVDLGFNRIARSDILEHTSYILGSILLCHLISPLQALLISYSAGKLLSVSYLMFRFQNWRIFIPRTHWRELKPIIKFGSYVQMGNICNLVAGSMMPIVLGKFVGPAAVGLVTWVMRIVWMPQSITGYIDNISFATFCRLEPKEERYRWILTSLTQLMVAFTGVYLMVLNLFYPEMLHYVFGRQWENTRTMVLLFSSYIFAYSGCTVLVQSIFANNGAGFLFKMSFFTMVATWIIAPALIYFYNANGYGYFMVLSLLFPLGLYMRGRQITKFEWRVALLKPIYALAVPSIAFILYRVLLVPESLNYVYFGAELFVVTAASLVLHYWLWAREVISKAKSQNFEGDATSTTDLSAFTPDRKAG